MNYDVVIGLEVHAELKTNTKCFCSCKNESGNEPNTNCCPVCVGLPGALPVLNKFAVEQTIRAGLALGFEINKTAIFERKNYFYPDLSKAYQISQLVKPICINGSLRVGEKDIPINRIHLEEDAGKLVHANDGSTLVDYNRGGVPLIELVTEALQEPHIETADEAIEFLEKLRQVYIYAGVADCLIEKGQMRADVNVSLKPKGSKEFGTKVEMKNIMGFKSVHRAIQYEIERQRDILDDGGKIEQETRKWDDDKGISFTLRTKENSQDYRYFPDPDLLAVEIDDSIIENVKNTMPMLPQELKNKYMQEYGLSEYDADVLLQFKHVSDFYNDCLSGYNQPKTVCNWLTTEIMARIKTETGAGPILISKQNLIWLMKNVDDKKINRLSAKEVLSQIWGTDLNAEEEAKRQNLIIDIDTSALDGIVKQVVENNANVVSQFKETGDSKILNFLVGQVMKETRGKANAGDVMAKIKDIVNS
ncbi:MAG: Asp-tRNA(Asn)/Glu-tRNA(Gln) amidotransferase subunit GatB [Clostridia bacterium]|nr:Asp-tRNA(Asn)/Glu-tRNA(Gln) amidotransferase subunit GatB [Clostridia bacterium]